jgi:vitamin B12 transporter
MSFTLSAPQRAQSRCALPVYDAAQLSRVVLLLCLSCSPYARAQTVTLPEVRVNTPAVYAQPWSEALANTQVIDRRTIEQSGAWDLPSLLRDMAGLDIIQTGGLGTQSSLFMRGGSSNHTLVLVDGVPINTVSSGTAAIEHIPLGMIEKVEIVRGNLSSLYGSGALGGVIQIFTRSATHNKNKPVGETTYSGSVQVGELGFTQVQTSLQKQVSSGTQLSATVENLSTNGLNATNQAELPGTNPDRDGYARRAWAVGWHQALPAQGQARLLLRRAFGVTQYDNDQGPSHQADAFSFVEQGAQLQTQWALQPHLTWHVNFQRSQAIFNADLTAYPYRYATQNQGWHTHLAGSSGSGQETQAQHHWQLGWDDSTQNLTTDTQYARDRRGLQSVYAAYQSQWEGHEAQFHIRQDRYSDFGQATTYYAGYGYRLSPAWRVQGSVSSGFRAPTFTELYYPGYSNAALRPEQLRTNELALQYTQAAQIWRLTWFQNRYSQLINGIQNTGALTLPGWEGAYTRQVPHGGRLQAQVAAYQAKDSQGQWLTRRAPRRVQTQWTQPWAGSVWNLQWRAYSFRQDAFFDPITYAQTPKRLGGYGLVNFTFTRPIAGNSGNKRWNLVFRLENVFNKNYALAYGYQQAGRQGFIGLQW